MKALRDCVPLELSAMRLKNSERGMEFITYRPSSLQNTQLVKKACQSYRGGSDSCPRTALTNERVVTLAQTAML